MGTPYTQADSSRHMYNTRADKYDDSHHPRFAKHMADTLALQPGESLLDLACGTGLLTLPAADDVGSQGKVVGIDIADGMLRELQSKIDNAGGDQYGHVKVYNHDITRLSELPALRDKSDYFDAISCASALVLLREPGVALQEWSDYLKPGGRLITDVTDAGNIPYGTAMERVFDRLGIEAPHNRAWAVDGDSLKKVLLSAGFEVEKVWFKESTGLGVQEHDVSKGEQVWEVVKTKPLCNALLDLGLIDAAKPLFLEEWRRLANEDGKIMETDGVWCALARKPAASPPMGRGSCACGAIMWTAYAPVLTTQNCHCSLCRKISGAPYITFLELPRNKLSFMPPFGKPFMKRMRLSRFAERGFCRECGTSILMDYDNEVDEISIAAGMIDERSCVEGWYDGPTKHIYTGDVPGWYEIPHDGKEREVEMEVASRLLVDKTR